MAKSKKRESKPDVLREMDDLLTKAARLVDSAAKLVKPAGLDSRNTRRLGEALVKVFDVQHEIYDRRPELVPDFLKNCDRFKKRKQSN